MTDPHDIDGVHPDGSHPDGAQPDGQGRPEERPADESADDHTSTDTPDEKDAATEPHVTTSAEDSATQDSAIDDGAIDDGAIDDGAIEDEDHSTEGQDGAPRSGLRNPVAAVRGIGAGALAIEAVILLLALVPLRVLDVRHTSIALGCVLGIVVLCVLLAGMMRREWAWKAGIVPPILVIACGYFHFSLAVIGVLFLLVWLYVLSVRRTVLGRGRADSGHADSGHADSGHADNDNADNDNDNADS